MKNSKLDRAARRLSSPRSWRIATRRIFLLTLPAAVPLWLASLLAMFLVMFARALAQPVVRFWSDPPVRGSAYDYYGYYRGHSRRTGNAQIVPFALPAAVEPELEKSAA